MSNVINKLVGLGPRFCAGTLRKAVGVSAGTKPVKNFLGPAREALIIGREDRWWNRSIRGRILSTTPDFAVARSAIENFAPKETKEVLKEMAKYLKAWGHEPVLEYFFRFGSGTYTDVVNTSAARSTFLRTAYKGRPLGKIDRQIASGQVVHRYTRFRQGRGSHR